MRSLLVAMLALIASIGSVSASEGEVVLTLKNADQVHEFTVEDLRSIGEREIVTTTIWSEGEQSFVGVSLDRLLAETGVEGQTLEAAAVNDYAVEIPTSDAQPGGPIIAYMRNGNLMSLRDKGPLWVIYPYDSDVAFRTEEVYSRSIWQLNRITVK
ncbi:oxidoreductase [Ruegeria sp. TM1040]|uniref:oxidoreductase n=1 Tax=Rhodobacterales TaxID=204455 RepID=UPI0000557116|nr:oxidoreductase [Ruegeria sp. TM1040]ABF63694.1 conserved hypothetical protein [Ruegeria sp. TM1040]MDF9302478.1 oxidoreductase [Tritonibacter mobilis]